MITCHRTMRTAPQSLMIAI